MQSGLLDEGFSGSRRLSSQDSNAGSVPPITAIKGRVPVLTHRLPDLPGRKIGEAGNIVRFPEVIHNQVEVKISANSRVVEEMRGH